MALRLCPVAASAFALVRHIEVEPDQSLFCGTVKQAFDSAEDGVDFHAIFLHETAIGFFRIDRTHGLARSSELGLRGFMIDRRHQNKGYANQALLALPAYLKTQYPESSGLVLTVDQQNLLAIHLYRRTGFDDLGELHFGGLFGLQKVLRAAFA
ncbi:MAG: hypothetical protein BM559_08870 [Roseobacter sp. MedPE-SWchi]|nr:MAG: hypothetical protein BM559_08870 [Roseobacter sp. MedPE-SWchi]